MDIVSDKYDNYELPSKYKRGKRDFNIFFMQLHKLLCIIAVIIFISNDEDV